MDNSWSSWRQKKRMILLTLNTKRGTVDHKFLLIKKNTSSHEAHLDQEGLDSAAFTELRLCFLTCRWDQSSPSGPQTQWTSFSALFSGGSSAALARTRLRTGSLGRHSEVASMDHSCGILVQFLLFFSDWRPCSEATPAKEDTPPSPAHQRGHITHYKPPDV